MSWLADVLGHHIPRNAKVVLPTPEFFPDEYDATDAAAETMFGRVCGYLGVDRSRVELSLVTARTNGRDGKLFIQSEGGAAAGTYQAKHETRLETITIERLALREPMALVATMAHELCHVHLLGDARVSRDEEDHEPLTDLLTVFMGMGIFGANASVRYAGWTDGSRYGWSTSSLGYLRQETWAYALGAFAFLRAEERPVWSRHLRADVRSSFTQTLRYLKTHGLQSSRQSAVPATPTSLAVPPTPAAPEHPSS